MHIDPILPVIVGTSLVVLLIVLLLRLAKQPAVVGYLIAGVVIGPQGLGLITDISLIEHMGSLGVILLLFFIGMELQPKQLLAQWKVSVGGTLLQILVTMGSVFIAGYFLDWPLARIVLLGFVVSLSSTAVVLKLLQERNELNTPTGQKVLGILLTQDMAVVPMIIVLGLLSGTTAEPMVIGLQLVGAVILFALVYWLLKSPEIHLPLSRMMHFESEIQVNSALIICFGLSLLTGIMHLSTALGAFIGGMLITKMRETHWVHHSLAPFRVVFLGMFFISIGMLIDLQFVFEEWWVLVLIVVLVLLTNTFINAWSLKLLGVNWRESLYAGALLAQIGEFSFVLASIGLQAGLISRYSYQMTIIVIALTLLVSPSWIQLAKKLTHVR